MKFADVNHMKEVRRDTGKVDPATGKEIFEKVKVNLDEQKYCGSKEEGGKF